MYRNRSVLIGTSTELGLLPADARPGTFFWNTTTKELYILDITNGRWYAINNSTATSAGEGTSNDYHLGV